MTNVKRKKMLEKKQKADKRANKIWLVIAIAFSLGIVVYYGNYLREGFKFEKSLKQYVGKTVPDSIICMISNTIIADTPDTVTIDGKIYRGCCPTCISKLKYNMDNSRYAIDPYSKHSIDKAEAFITTTDGYGNVIYFENEGDFKRYSTHNHFENKNGLDIN